MAAVHAPGDEDLAGVGALLLGDLLDGRVREEERLADVVVAEARVGGKGTAREGSRAKKESGRAELGEEGRGASERARRTCCWPCGA